MATSLAEQLKKLRTPQTGLLQQDKKRQSLLFDPKEAANLDREIVLNIGQSGLQDLIKLCSSFAEFENTLFAQSSMSLERSVQDSTLNKRLDAGIEKFLILLSPYFLLNTAHKALEWLIHRFNIHLYNRDQFILLILPYHETRIFVRALQLLNLKDTNDRWNWLEPLQKPGIPLSSMTLVNRVATDTGLLKLLCRHVVEATTIYSERASCLSTLYAFYTMSIVGAIEKTSVPTDVQTSYILSSLAKGLSSEINDFAASTYMIAAKLSTRASLDNETLDYIILKTLKSPKLSYEAFLLIFFIYENSLNRPYVVTEKIVTRLAKSRDFVEQTKRIRNIGVDVAKFIVPMLETCVNMIIERKPDDSVNLRLMIDEILEKVSFDDREIDLILERIIKIDGKNLDVCEISRIYLADLCDNMEKRYPRRFDEYLKNLMKHSENDVSSSRLTLQFLMSWHSGARNAKDSLDILDRLNHNSAAQRIAALDIIGRGEIDITETFRDMINNALRARFSDDDSRVIKKLLEFPRKRLMSLFSNDTLVDELMTLLAQCNSRKTSGLAPMAIKLLLDMCEDADDTLVFIATLPYLFPREKHDINLAMQILNSQFSIKNPYMSAVREDMGDNPDVEAISSAAFHNILKWQLLPPTSNILATIKLQSCRGDATSMFFNLVLLGSVCRVPVGSLPCNVALEVIEIAAQMTRQYPRVKRLLNCNQLNGDKISEALALTSEGILPLQACTYVIEMIHRRVDIKTNSRLDFENEAERTKLILRLLEILLQGMELEPRRDHYSWCLRIFFQRHFSSSREMLVFLSQFFVKPVVPATSLHCLKISLDLIDNSRTYNWIFDDDVFVTNLLIALSRENRPCRVAAVDILKKLSHTFNLTMEGFTIFFNELSRNSEEFSIDNEQLSLALYSLLSPDPDVTHQLKRETRLSLDISRKRLFAVIIDDKVPIHRVAQLLDVLTHVNGPEILCELANIGNYLHRKIIANTKNQNCVFFATEALRNILQRFTSATVESLRDTSVMKLFDSAICDHCPRIYTTDENSNLSTSLIMIRQIDQLFWSRAGKISTELQKIILARLVDVVTNCEIGTVVAACNRAVGRIVIDASIIVDELSIMRDARLSIKDKTSSRTKRRTNNDLPRPEITSSIEWKRGITLLEFVQRATNIERDHLLIPVLFEILRISLSFEIQSPLEYVNQLLLSTIYHLMTKSRPLKDAHLHIDLIAQCIRISHNPQTHHHALLVLVELFKIANLETALHSIMPIFTFMGSSVLRQDDAYSIQIISKTIETVVPIVNSTNNETQASEILRIFVCSLPHIPEHRRIPVFVKLLQLLETHRHLFFLLTFESHVLAASKQSSIQKSSSERLEFALAICKEFSPLCILEICVKILKFFRILPIEIDDCENKREKLNFTGKHIFDVTNNTPKELRHYKYTIVQFLSAILSSTDFIDRLASLESSEMENIEKLYDRLIVEIIVVIESSSRSADINQSKPKGKYWKILLHNLYDILDAVNNLLPNGIFIATILRLVNHDLLSVRKKALELLNSRLQQKKFYNDDKEQLLAVIEPLVDIVSRQGKMLSTELETIQQTALITLKHMARLLANENPTYFKPILDLTTELMSTKEGPLLASSVLCVAELCGSMRTHAIQSLNKFVPAMIRLLRTHCNHETPDIVVVGIVSALQKIVESVGNFLSLYLDQLLLELTRLSSLYTDTEHPKIGLIVPRLKATTQKLASCIPMRVLLPAVTKTYDHLLISKSYRSISPLMIILAESFAHLSSNVLQSSIPDLAAFFLNVLQFRENVIIIDDGETMMTDETNIATYNDVLRVEESASDALVALVLKLSEATFRPLYYKLYDWAARYPERRQRNITFYRLSANIAERLKSLFVLFAGHFLKHAAALLTANNNITTEGSSELTLPVEKNRIELVEAIMMTLHRVFTYDSHNFINQERFETLAQPIVDQLENTIGTREDYERRASELFIPCVASFAGATQDDSLHKQLIYQTLLKTRHAKPYVRSAALGAIVEIARKLGEDFMPLLPETVPFLAELLEDEDEITEKKAQEAVRTLEDILGEQLQKYF